MKDMKYNEINITQIITKVQHFPTPMVQHIPNQYGTRHFIQTTNIGQYIQKVLEMRTRQLSNSQDFLQQVYTDESKTQEELDFS